MKTFSHSFGTLVLLFLLWQPCHSQSIKESPVGKFGLELFEALNGNDKEKRLHFITTNLDSRALENGSAEWLKKFEDLYNTVGASELLGVKEGRDPDEVQLIIKGIKTGRQFEIATHLSRESRTKLIGFIYHAIDGTSPLPETKKSQTDVVRQLQGMVEEAVAANRFSGSVLITRAEQTLLASSYGYSDQLKKIKNRNDTKFNLGSINKMFTSVAIAQLVQAGKLSFTDTLSVILPDYPNKVNSKRITLHHLLTHTAGLGDFFKPAFFDHREKYVSLGNYLPLFAQDDLLFDPGKGWSYSNAGFIVLGLVIEKVSGENYFDYVRNHIFIPSGMKDTDSYERDATIQNLATGYTQSEKDPQGTRVDNKSTLPIKGSSAGGGYSTTNDLLLFSKALMGYKLVNKDLTISITNGKVNTPRGKYGYGFSDQIKSGRHVIGHGGGAPGINSELSMVTDGNYTVIVLGNYDPPAATELAMRLVDVLIQP